MKATLTKQTNLIYHYVDGKRVEGKHECIIGYVNGIRGDVSGIRGNVTDISGDVTGIRGDVSGIYGNVTFISGNLDDCEITDEERQHGIDIKQLIK